MKREAVSGMMLTLLLMSILTLALNIHLVGAEPKTWYVDDNGGADFTKIQDAIYAASAGDTIFVYSGLYPENLIVRKERLTIVGESKSNTIIDGQGDVVVSIYRNRVSVRGFTLLNGGRSWFIVMGSVVLLDGSENAQYCNISDNIVSNGQRGISSFFGSHNTICRNTISDTNQGIVLFHSTNETVINNTISDGVHYGSDPPYGIHAWHGSDHTVIGNTVIGYCAYGIAIRYADENHISRNTLSENFYGIELGESSCDNTVTENSASGNGVGISIFQNSRNNLIAMNKFSNSIPIDPFTSNIGIWLDSSQNNTIYNNNITNNGYGFYIYLSPDNEIYHNSLIDNTAQVYNINSESKWDDGYPSGGNYWGDYEQRYPDAQELDDSGLWDTPYVIDENNQDNYPLMEPWTAPTIPTTIDELKTAIEELGLQGEIDNPGIATSLLAKLDAAQKLIDEGKTDQAKNLLNAFISEVQAQSGKHITPEAAELLIQAAEHILSNL